LFYTARFYRAVFFAFMDALLSVLLLLLLGAMISGADTTTAKAGVLHMLLPPLSDASFTLLFWVLVCLKAIAFGAKNYSTRSLAHHVAMRMRNNTLNYPKVEAQGMVNTMRNFVTKGIVVILADGLFLLIATAALLTTEPLMALSLWIYVGIGLMLQSLFANSIQQQHLKTIHYKPKILRKEKFIRTHWNILQTWKQLDKEIRILNRRRHKLLTIFKKQLITQSLAESAIPFLFFGLMGTILFLSQQKWNLTAAMQLQSILLLIYCQSPTRRILRTGRFIRAGWKVLKISTKSTIVSERTADIRPTSSHAIHAIEVVTGNDKDALRKTQEGGKDTMMAFQMSHNNVAFFSLALEINGETLLSGISIHREESERKQLTEIFRNFDLNEMWLDEKVTSSFKQKLSMRDRYRLAFIKCLHASFEYIVATKFEIMEMHLSEEFLENQLQKHHKKIILC